MATQLVDQFGYVVRSGAGGLYDSTRADSRTRPMTETKAEAFHKGFTYFDHKTLMSASRRLWANFPIIKSASYQKTRHSVGRAFDPVFLGEDTNWGAQATSWLTDEWYSLCNVRGPQFDFKTSAFLESTEIDRSGNVGTILTQTPSGYPKFQHVSAHRIGMRNGSSGIVGDSDAITILQNEDGTTRTVHGYFKGLRIELGVIYASYGAPVGYRVLGDSQAQDQDILARDFDHAFDPEHVDQGVGLPVCAGSINWMASSFESHDAEMRALVAASFIALLEWNEAGAMNTTDPKAILGSTTAGEQTFTQQTLEKGMVKYFKAGGGGKIEAFQSARPSDQWDRFNDRIVRIALADMDWPYTFAWKSDQLTGTGERSAIEQARASIKERQDLLIPRQARKIRFAVSKAMQIGILPPYKGKDIGGFLKWGFSLPPEFNIDHGRESKSWLEMNARGAENLSDWLLSAGKGTLTNHLRVREVEMDAILETAKRLSERHKLPLEYCVNLVRQNSPNPPPMTQPVDTPLEP